MDPTHAHGRGHGLQVPTLCEPLSLIARLQRWKEEV